MRTNTSRRKFMAVAGSSVVAGIAGCSGGNNNNTPTDGDGGSGSTPEPENAAIESLDVGANSIVVALTGNVETDTLRLVSPDGTERSSGTVSEGVDTVELEYFSDDEDDAYTAGEHTVVAAYEDEVVQERAVDIRPELSLTEFEAKRNGFVGVTVENSGNGVAWLREGWMYTDQQGDESLDPVENGGDIIPPGETSTVNFQADALDYNTNDDSYDEYCTGEGAFAQDLSVSVEEQALGTLGATGISMSLTGEQETSFSTDSYTCGTTEVAELPVTLTQSE